MYIKFGDRIAVNPHHVEAIELITTTHPESKRIKIELTLISGKTVVIKDVAWKAAGDLERCEEVYNKVLDWLEANQSISVMQW